LKKKKERGGKENFGARSRLHSTRKRGGKGKEKKPQDHSLPSIQSLGRHALEGRERGREEGKRLFRFGLAFEWLHAFRSASRAIQERGGGGRGKANHRRNCGRHPYSVLGLYQFLLKDEEGGKGRKERPVRPQSPFRSPSNARSRVGKERKEERGKKRKRAAKRVWHFPSDFSLTFTSLSLTIRAE